MARKISSREWTLIVLLGALGLFALYYGRTPRVAAGGDVSSLGELRIVDPPQIHMALLEEGAVPYDSGGRSLFKYYTPPPPPRKAPPKPAAKAPTPRQVVKAPPPRPTTPAVRGPSVPKPPRIPFQYIGHMGPKDSRLAVFEQGEEILIAGAGEILNDQFKVVEFKYEAVVMGYTDKRFSDQTTELKQKSR